MSDRSTLFPVYERPAYIMDKRNTPYVAKGYKAIVRAHPLDPSTPDTIAIVRDTYSVVQTKDVVAHIEDEMRRSFGPSALTNARIVSRTSYGGSRTFDDYVFPNIGQPVGSSTVQFKTTLINSYDGSTGVRLYVGGEYFICSNGMVSGDYELISKKHVGQLIMPSLSKHFTTAIMSFADDGEKWRKWADLALVGTNAHELVKAYPGSEQQQAKLAELYMKETEQHGFTLWAMYNAGTFFASHGEVRKSTNDNEAAIRLDRSLLVRQWTQTKTWRELSAA